MGRVGQTGWEHIGDRSVDGPVIGHCLWRSRNVRNAVINHRDVDALRGVSAPRGDGRRGRAVWILKQHDVIDTTHMRHVVASATGGIRTSCKRVCWKRSATFDDPIAVATAGAGDGTAHLLSNPGSSRE